MLRGVAILLVLAIHVPHDAPGGWRENPWTIPAFLSEFGYLGVPLFIVISGFCIHRAAAKSKATTGSYEFRWGSFWRRRFIRLYPPYLAAIAFSLASAHWLHGRFVESGQVLGWDLGTHLLLVHNLTSEFAGSLGNGPFWSLGTEEQLYALYVVLLLMLARMTMRVSLLIVALVSVAWRILVPLLPAEGVDLGPFHLGNWSQWPFHYWLHWSLGACAIEAHLGMRRLPTWSQSWRWASVLLALGLLGSDNTFQWLAKTNMASGAIASVDPLTRGVVHNLGDLLVLGSFFCLLNCLLASGASGRLRGRVATWLAGVGRISYSIYLVHIPVIYILLEHVTLGGTPVEWLPRMLLFAVPALMVGYVFHHAIERWFLHGSLPRWPAGRVSAAGTSA